MKPAHSNSAHTKVATPQLFTNKDWWWALIVFFITYAAFLITLYPTVTTEDSGEFTSAVNALGIAHPSGYPTYIILAKIFTFLIPFGNLAWRVNVFSAFTTAASFAALYLLVKALTKDYAVGLITALFTASGAIIWSQAIRAEVYGLNSFFLILVILLVYIWYANVQTDPFAKNHPADKYLSIVSIVMGLSIGNHHLMFMIGAPLIIFVLIAKPKILFNFPLITKIVLFFLLGLSIYLFIPIRASMHPDINWGNATTWQSFWDHVSRRVYSVQNLDAAGNPVYYSGTSTGNPVIHFFTENIGQFFTHYAVIIDQNYTWIFALLSVFGFVYLWKISKPVFWFFITLVIFNGPILSSMMGLGTSGKLPLEQFTEKPFYIPIILTTAILAGCGIRYLASLAAAAGKKTAAPEKRFHAALFVVVLLTAFIFYKIPANNQSNNYLAYDIAKSTLNLLPQGAVLHSENGDNTLFPLLYLQKTEKYRTDVKIYMSMPVNIYPFFVSLEELQKDNPGKRYFTDFPFIYYGDNSYDYDGPVSEILLSNQTPSTSQQKINQLQSAVLRGINNSNLDHFNQYLKARWFVDLGLAASTDHKLQDELFLQAFQAAPDSQNITGQLIGNYYVTHEGFAQAIPYLEAAHHYMPNEYSINFQLIVSYAMNNQQDKAKELLKTSPVKDQKLMLGELQKLSQKYQSLGLLQK